MAYALQPMLRIREVREDKAQTALAGARRVRREAERTREAREKDFAKFEETKEKRRDAVYNSVMNLVVPKEKFDLVIEGLARIDQEGVLLKDNVRQAEAVVREKLKLEDEAHGLYIVASRNRQKIVEHRAIWEEEDRRDREFRAEAELEDFAGRKIVAEDDDAMD